MVLSFLICFLQNDLLLFVDSTCSQMRAIKRCLDDFAIASTQKINLENLKIFFSPNFIKEEATCISVEAGIPIADDLGRYLAMQLVHHRYGKTWYTKLLERYKARMDDLKTKCLSLAGQITLAKSFLSSIPVF